MTCGINRGAPERENSPCRRRTRLSSSQQPRVTVVLVPVAVVAPVFPVVAVASAGVPRPRARGSSAASLPVSAKVAVAQWRRHERRSAARASTYARRRTAAGAVILLSGRVAGTARPGPRRRYTLSLHSRPSAIPRGSRTHAAAYTRTGLPFLFLSPPPPRSSRFLFPSLALSLSPSPPSASLSLFARTHGGSSETVRLLAPAVVVPRRVHTRSHRGTLTRHRGKKPAATLREL